MTESAPKAVFTVNQSGAPSVIFSMSAYRQLLAYISAAGNHMLGFMGTVKEEGNNVFFIDRILLPEQTVTAASVEISAESYAQLLLPAETWKAGESNDPVDAAVTLHNQLCFFGLYYSQACGLLPSATNLQTIRQLLENHDFIIHGMFNREKARFDLHTSGNRFEALSWHVRTEETGTILTEAFFSGERLPGIEGTARAEICQRVRLL